MKAIHNWQVPISKPDLVVLYPKDTEKWKQFTTAYALTRLPKELFCIPKILKNESNSQPLNLGIEFTNCCFVSQRYWKMKAIHNDNYGYTVTIRVVLYPKDTEKWKQFTTIAPERKQRIMLFCIPKILKNESNSQLLTIAGTKGVSCFVSQRYWKMKAIHNTEANPLMAEIVVLYPKDTEKWKQFTTQLRRSRQALWLFCIPKILKNESNSQL